MKITLDISMYPLDADYKPPIKSFIRDLRGRDGIELVTSQMSTQVRGEFDAVWDAVNACMKKAMREDGKVVFVSKCLNSDLDITRAPDIDS